MSINMMVLGATVQPTVDAMYDYLALIPRYESLEVRGKVQASYHKGQGLHCAFIGIDAMIALNDTTIYTILLLTPEEQNDLALLEQADRLWRALVTWCEGKTTFVHHHHAATIAFVETPRVELFTDALNPDTFVLHDILVEQKDMKITR